MKLFKKRVTKTVGAVHTHTHNVLITKIAMPDITKKVMLFVMFKNIKI